MGFCRLPIGDLLAALCAAFMIIVIIECMPAIQAKSSLMRRVQHYQKPGSKIKSNEI